MYLSAFTLDFSDPSVRQCIRDAHDMHRTVMSGFEDIGIAGVRREFGVLYRLGRRRGLLPALLFQIDSPAK